MPGPDNLYVVSESITRGSKTGISISIGLVSGVFVHTALAATGISIVLQQSEIAYTILKYAGAAYLLWLAYQASTEKPLTLANPNDDYLVFRFGKLFRKGFLMNVLNPKVSLFFIAFLPQFITPNGWSVVIQMLVLGALFILSALLVFTIMASLAGSLSHLLNQPKFWTITKWSKVILLITLAIFLVFD